MVGHMAGHGWPWQLLARLVLKLTACGVEVSPASAVPPLCCRNGQGQGLNQLPTTNCLPAPNSTNPRTFPQCIKPGSSAARLFEGHPAR